MRSGVDSADASSILGSSISFSKLSTVVHAANSYLDLAAPSSPETVMAVAVDLAVCAVFGFGYLITGLLPQFSNFWSMGGLAPLLGLGVCILSLNRGLIVTALTLPIFSDIGKRAGFTLMAMELAHAIMRDYFASHMDTTSLGASAGFYWVEAALFIQIALIMHRCIASPIEKALTQALHLASKRFFGVRLADTLDIAGSTEISSCGSDTSRTSGELNCEHVRDVDTDSDCSRDDDGDTVDADAEMVVEGRSRQWV
jgi:hypothetical protein